MKLVDRQVLRELIGPFVFGVAMFTSVFFAGKILLDLTNWLMNGMPVLTALEIVLYSLPSTMFWTLPMSTLLAVLTGVGRLSGESEIVALYAGGVSFYRIALPILGLGLVVSGFSMLFNDRIAPIAATRITAIKAAVLKTAAVSDQPFTLEDTGTNSRIIVKGGMDKDQGVLRDVTIVQYGLKEYQNKPLLLLYASRAEWAGMNDPTKRYRWKLYDGYTQLIDPRDPRSIGTATFVGAQTREVEIQKTREELAMYQNLNPEQMSFADLSRVVRILRAYPDRPIEKIRQLELDTWNKIAVPLTSLVFALLAAPLGIRAYRSSSSMGLGLSILVILLYWIVGRYTWSLAVQGNVTPAAGAFAPNIIGLVAAYVLLRRAAK
jgi:lipopolysaccharide export system permease protein